MYKRQGPQHRLDTESSGLPAQHHAGDSIGEGPKAPSQTVIDLHSGVDELDRHRVQKGIGVELQSAQSDKYGSGPPEAGPGEIKDGVDGQCQGEADVEDPFEGDGSVPVRPTAQKGLGDDSGQTPDGGKNTRLPAGKAPSQQQCGLIAGKGGKQGPVDQLHQEMCIRDRSGVAEGCPFILVRLKGLEPTR